MQEKYMKEPEDTLGQSASALQAYEHIGWDIGNVAQLADGKGHGRD